MSRASRSAPRRASPARTTSGSERIRRRSNTAPTVLPEHGVGVRHMISLVAGPGHPDRSPQTGRRFAPASLIRRGAPCQTAIVRPSRPHQARPTRHQTKTHAGQRTVGSDIRPTRCLRMPIKRSVKIWCRPGRTTPGSTSIRRRRWSPPRHRLDTVASTGTGSRSSGSDAPTCALLAPVWRRRSSPSPKSGRREPGTGRRSVPPADPRSQN